jgi:hypothetical protein
MYDLKFCEAKYISLPNFEGKMVQLTESTSGMLQLTKRKKESFELKIRATRTAGVVSISEKDTRQSRTVIVVKYFGPVFISVSCVNLTYEAEHNGDSWKIPRAGVHIGH